MKSTLIVQLFALKKNRKFKKNETKMLSKFILILSIFLLILPLNVISARIIDKSIQSATTSDTSPIEISENKQRKISSSIAFNVNHNDDDLNVHNVNDSDDDNGAGDDDRRDKINNEYNLQTKQQNKEGNRFRRNSFDLSPIELPQQTTEKQSQSWNLFKRNDIMVIPSSILYSTVNDVFPSDDDDQR